VLRARLGLLDGENHSFVMRQIADARVAGYAEAIEATARLLSAFVSEAEGRKSEYPDVIPTEINTAKWLARRVRELAPAAMTKEPK
jgi:hypothetical protein